MTKLILASQVVICNRKKEKTFVNVFLTCLTSDFHSVEMGGLGYYTYLNKSDSTTRPKEGRRKERKNMDMTKREVQYHIGLGQGDAGGWCILPGDPAGARPSPPILTSPPLSTPTGSSPPGPANWRGEGQCGEAPASAAPPPPSPWRSSTRSGCIPLSASAPAGHPAGCPQRRRGGGHRGGAHGGHQPGVCPHRVARRGGF